MTWERSGREAVSHCTRLMQSCSHLQAVCSRECKATQYQGIWQPWNSAGVVGNLQGQVFVGSNWNGVSRVSNGKWGYNEKIHGKYRESSCKEQIERREGRKNTMYTKQNCVVWKGDIWGKQSMALRLLSQNVRSLSLLSQNVRSLPLNKHQFLPSYSPTFPVWPSADRLAWYLPPRLCYKNWVFPYSCVL